ncbi:MAG: DNA repair protein RecO [Proteobacteria bacterium]|nr:DNA repair protein RecO [Pseudomonadota bacterium]
MVKTRALLLRAVDYGEADRIVSLLTETEGVISAIARGARRSRRRFSGTLQSLCVLRVGLGRTRGSLGALELAEVEEAFPALLGDLGRMQQAGDALRLVRHLVAERQAEPGLFALCVQLMRLLSERDAPPAALPVCFELRALSVVGFAPAFDACGSCGKRPSCTQSSEFDPRSGALRCRACGGGPIRLGPELRRRARLATTSAWVEAGKGCEHEDLTTLRRTAAAFRRLRCQLPE